MTDPRKQLILEAIQRALRARRDLGLDLADAHSVFDSVERLGIEVRFDRLGKVEGLYRPSPDPMILINSDRPLGRQAFTCAHELGHHYYGDGASIDTLTAAPFSGGVREFRTDVFAGILLMPKAMIQGYFRRRGWTFSSVTPERLFTASSHVGVGYTTMAYHLSLALELISRDQLGALLKVQPKAVKESLLSFGFSNELVIVDNHWNNRPVDLQVGDIAVIPDGASWSGTSIRKLTNCRAGVCLEAITPGIGRLSDARSDLAAFIRVCRRNYVGRNMYRHIEELDDESA